MARLSLGRVAWRAVRGAVGPRRALGILALSLVGLATFAAACRTNEPKTPVATCRSQCEAMASEQCTPAECERGCEFILDRLVEREGKNVLACVARTKRRCTDPVWASCAAHVGPHADGGPPPPNTDWVNDD